MSADAHKSCCSWVYLQGQAQVCGRQPAGLSVTSCVLSFHGASLVKSNTVPGVSAELPWRAGG